MTRGSFERTFRRARWLVVAGMLLLASCTGTFEEGPPTLLVIGFDDGAPQLGLVEDTFRALDPAGRDLVFVAGSARPLPEPAVAIDVVDRGGTRPTAVVLSRGTGEAPPTYLRGFSLQGIDPAAPSAFTEDPAFAFTLANAGGGDEGLLDARLSDDYCLVDAQISRTGRYLALFEDRSVCGGASFRAAYVLDLVAADAGNDPFVAVLDAPAPTAAGLYLDPQDDLDPQARDAVYIIDPSEGLQSFQPSTGTTRVVLEPDPPFDPSAILDIGRVGDALILLEANAYLIVDATTRPATVTRIASTSDLDRIVSDPLGLSMSTVLLADDALVVHADVAAASFASESGAPTRADATLEPIDLFVYLLGDERIDVFDLLTFEGARVQVRAFDVPEIVGATVLTWTRAAVDAVP